MSDTHTLGVLLLNVGTPDAPTPDALHRYLDEFLSDPKVIDYPRWLWQPILQGIILRVRPQRSAALYARVWRPEGSPLLSISHTLAAQLAASLQAEIGARVVVEIGMRYGSPSIQHALDKLHEAAVDQLVVLPLFPQYSDTTTGTSLGAFEGALPGRCDVPVSIIHDYHDHPAYIDALAVHIECHWAHHPQPARLLLSFHGIPARYLRKGDPYREQCERTAALLSARLGLKNNEWRLSFQSRFGPEPWLQPYTDKTLEAWGAEGIRSAHAVCPGFAIDCLETVDEIGHEGCRTFQEAGSGAFDYIPALNDSPEQVALFTQLVLENITIPPASRA